ncbi:MAG: ribosome biogenesis GTPase YlqF [Bacilli bacterium]|nr:ribosome biogenesis GTPase YlqF [Bacilli bacterium]
MNENKTNINWYPGHMAKTKRLIRENLSYIDVIYELVDSRMPYSSKIQEIDDIVSNKPRVIIMTKYDLCDKVETNKWVKYYESLGYKVIKMDIEHDFDKKVFINTTKEILKDKNDKRIEKGLETRKYRVLIMGIPNVGKSTLINRLVGRKATKTGNTPGVTKDVSWIRIDDNLELLDTPGILWPKIDVGNIALNLASFTAIKEEILPLNEVSFYILETLEKFYPDKLEERYGFNTLDEDIVVNLDMIGKKRGCLMRGGEIDYDKVITIIINDVKNGYINGITFDRCEDE